MKPILFNTEMVKAILDGRKTTTRRLINPQPKEFESQYDIEDGDVGFWGDEICRFKEPRNMSKYAGELKAVPIAPYKPGDILYVRETWAEMPYGYVYRADDEEPEGWDSDDRWRPSIHMPKTAARIFLKVTDVIVERLQEMGAQDSLYEGVKLSLEGITKGESPLRPFADLWDSTIPKKDLERYGWSANPWVWVIEFERVEKPKEEEDDEN